MGQACRRLPPGVPGSHASSALDGASPSNTASQKNEALSLPAGVHQSLYQRRVVKLAREAVEHPPAETLDTTLRKCIAFCYGVTCEWAPHVRVTVFADNSAENQYNAPVYDSLLCCWGVSGFSDVKVRCTPVPGTDVSFGHVTVSPFWARTVTVNDRQVPYRALLHQLFHWLVDLDDKDARKQLLINMVLQLHEACFNCIGRHKEVFEYCMYDLLDAEDENNPEGAPRVVARFAARFLDRHKRDALHAAVLSPLKFLCQHYYEVFENIDSHGASFWAAILPEAFFPGLELPYESIVGLDGGWSWAAVDFLPEMRYGDSLIALQRFSDPENLGRDWRTLTKDLRPPVGIPGRLADLPWATLQGFPAALAKARKEGSRLRRSLEPYAARLAALMARPVLLRRCALAAVSSVGWDVAEGPAFAALSEEALGEQLGPAALRARICGDCLDASRIEVDTETFARLLAVAGVPWA